MNIWERAASGATMTRQQTISAVIFDWGGVLIDNPTPVLVRSCSRALGVDEQDFATAYARLDADFQCGRISEQVFWQRLCAGLQVPPPETKGLWRQNFAMAYKPKQSVFGLAARLQMSGYKTGFLSNTEAPAMAFFLDQQYNCFDACVFSCAEGVRKPDRRIYEIASERLQVPPGACVFIDDREPFVRGAEATGMHGILFRDESSLLDELARLGVAAQ